MSVRTDQRSDEISSREGEGRLAAVLAADAVGFSAAMERDPTATIAQLGIHRAAMRRIAEENGGALVADPGDFLLVLLDSANAALRAAVAFLRHVQAAAGGNPADLDFRIGIDVGEVFAEGAGVLGTPINVAARLQQLAAPGSVMVSEDVVDMLPTSADYRLVSRGPVDLRNISRPVTAYALDVGDLSRAADVEAMPAVGPVAGGLPEIVVTGFEALGDAPRANVFADGITEELFATLGSLSAAFVCRERAAPGGDLHRRYELSGRVRNGDRLRITAKLVRCADKTTIWSERFDFGTDASYDAQERIAQSVVTALQIKLSDGEQARLWSTHTTSLAAWEQFHRGRLAEGRYRLAGHVEARRLYEHAIELDPTFVPAIVALGFCYIDQIRLGWSDDPTGDLMRARACYAQAANIDAGYPMAGALRAFIAYAAGENDVAVQQMRETVEAHPDNSDIVAYYATILYCVDNVAEAVRYGAQAIAMMPSRPVWMVANLAFALLACGRVDEARKQFELVLQEQGDYLRALIGLTLVETQGDRPDHARAYARRLSTVDPGFRVDRWAQTTMFANRTQREAYASALRGAGLA